jgi:hypothetical protein
MTIRYQKLLCRWVTGDRYGDYALSLAGDVIIRNGGRGRVPAIKVFELT